MAHSVIITTPGLTLDEMGKRLGLTKAEQKEIIRLVDEKMARGAGAARKANHASAPSAKSTGRRARRSTKEKNDRARTSA